MSFIKKCAICSIAVFLSIGNYAFAQFTTNKVAVYITGDVESSYKKVIGSKIVTSITRSADFIAIERTSDFLSELAKEQDYQMSGAVSDNQIVKIGQQFGVQFVLVAELSEVFESMFISARMINVQTGQITYSAEADGIVSNLESLTKLSETLTTRLLRTSKDLYKVVGPFSDAKSLYNYSVNNSEYRLATRDEIVQYIKKEGNRPDFGKIAFYVDINRSYHSKQQFYRYCNYSEKRSGRKLEKTRNDSRHISGGKVAASLITGLATETSINAYFLDDSRYLNDYNFNNKPPRPGYYGSYTDGLIREDINETIPVGMILLIKKITDE